MKRQLRNDRKGVVIGKVDRPLQEGGVDRNCILVPVRGEDRLHLLRSLIDRLVPGQTRLLVKRGHCLDQLINLRVKKRLPIAGLNHFRLICRASIPVLNRDLVRAAMDSESQIIRLSAEHQIHGINRAAEHNAVG